MIKTIKPQIFGAIVLSVINLLLISIIVAGLTGLLHPQPMMYILWFILFLFMFLLLLNYLKTKVIIDDQMITYSRLLKKNSLQYQNIIKVESHAKGQAGQHGVYGKYETVLYSEAESVSIPIKIFSRKDLKELATLLLSKCSQATIDEQTRLMTEGKMPSIFFKYQ
jgi:hypothetical protein